MATTREGTHTLPDGTKLYTKSWIPALPPTAILIFIHGFSDHCNAYYTLFPTLASHNILTHSFDQRGWGRSVHTPTDRGLTGPTSMVLADMTSFIQSHLPSPAPLFLMGHSMGGAEVLHYAARGPAEVRKQITGYLVESPFVALHEASQPSAAIVFAGKLASKVVPNMHMNNRLEPKWMSRDEQVVKEHVADELCHDTGTLEGLAGMLQRAEELDKGKVKFEDREGCRLWVAHGSGDRATSYAASARLVKRLNLKDLEFKSYDGWYHKLHAEPGEDKITFANDVARWILDRAGPASRAISKEAPTANLTAEASYGIDEPEDSVGAKSRL